jgi:hypothetical protein
MTEKINTECELYYETFIDVIDSPTEPIARYCPTCQKALQMNILWFHLMQRNIILVIL